MIGIVILNYNTWSETHSCINSIFTTSSGLSYHIYLVDNCSTIEPPSYINDLVKVNIDKISFLRAIENRGYSAGNNIGVKEALKDNCSEILISNNDVIFKDGTIKNLKDYLDNNNDVGIVGPKVYLSDNNIQAINCGVKMTLKEKYLYLLKKTPINFLIKDFLIRFNALDKNLNMPFQVYAVSGCCFMISKKCALEILPFDENPFLYEEENIIGMIMEMKGYKTIYYTGSEIIHKHGQSTQKLKGFSYACFVESEIYYIKNYLKNSTIEIIPLYIVRTIKFIFLCILNVSYRKSINTYFKKTLGRLKQKIN